jgi:spermidine synthase
MNTYRLFGCLLCLSAFLLFIIQPLSARILLPILGGTPSVWTTSMLFFQLLLLGGYVWAHINIRYFPAFLPPLLQVLIIIAGLFFMNWGNLPPLSYEDHDLTLWQLKTMFLMIGIPYFALATNAPLYQAIYERIKSNRESEHSKTPYSLYSLSNVGSFVALVAYPFIIEPFTTIDFQTNLWTYGYGALCIFIFISALVSKFTFVPRPKQSKNNKNNVTIKDIGLWLILSFLPVSLMLGVTSHVTTDIASVPLLWIIPLAFYIGSFVMAFSDPPSGLARNEKYLNIITFVFVALIFLSSLINLHKLLWASVIIHYVGFLFITTFCHLKLSQIKPHPSRLTLFFFILSIGGCLAGLFHSFIAHEIFYLPIEYFISLWIFCIVFTLRPSIGDTKNIPLKYLSLPVIVSIIALILFAIVDNTHAHVFIAVILTTFMIAFIDKKITFGIFATAMVVSIISGKLNFSGDIIYITRNKMGTLIIRDYPQDNIRHFIHGTTLHGMQSLPINDTPKISSYYHPDGPLGDIFDLFNEKNGNQSIAALGLGVGTVACYKKQRRNFHFYELDQDVVDIARNPDYFTYLSSCAPDVKITIGDARFNISKAKDNSYDMIIVDTFSSDAIPTHLLTTEAIEIYDQKLKEDGVIIFHTSNRYFDLDPIIAVNAALSNKDSLHKSVSNNINEPLLSASRYVVVSRNEALLNNLKTAHQWKPITYSANLKPWTDDYLNIFSVIKGF